MTPFAPHVCLSPFPARKRFAFASNECHSFRMNWREHIESNPGVLRGKPCVKGTRIPVALILGYLAAGRDAAAILKEFPDLTGDDVAACLHYARELAEFEAVSA